MRWLHKNYNYYTENYITLRSFARLNFHFVLFSRATDAKAFSNSTVLCIWQEK